MVGGRIKGINIKKKKNNKVFLFLFYDVIDMMCEVMFIDIKVFGKNLSLFERVLNLLRYF